MILFVTKAEFEIACCLCDGCRDEDELLPVFEQPRESNTSFNRCIDHMIRRGCFLPGVRFIREGVETALSCGVIDHLYSEYSPFLVR